MSTSLVILNAGEVQFLEDGFTGLAYTLHLYTNDVTDGLSPAEIDELETVDFDEATFTGYAAQSVAVLDWTVTAGDPSEAVSVEKTFTSTANQTAQLIYGWFLTRDSDNVTIAFDQFDGAVSIEFLNDSISLTPRVSLGDQSELGANMQLQVFTNDGTWNKPAGLRAVRIRLCGGGGGGAGAPSTGTDQRSGGGPGGGACYAESFINAADLGSSETVIVAAGGAGGAAGNNPGSPGGTSSFGSHVSASGGSEGGAGGAVSEPNVAQRFAGQGGTSGTGDVVLAGSGGTATIVPNSVSVRSSAAGSSLLGGGARGVTNSNGINGLGPGGGGSGGANNPSQGTNRSGGAGHDGIVIVEEYF
jgi:hypothetical protein